MMSVKTTLFVIAGLTVTVLENTPDVAVAQDAILSTYIGGSKTDALSGAAILPDDTIAVAGTFDASLGGPKGTTLEGGHGAVMLYDSDVKSLARAELPGQATDLDADAQSNIYVVGEFGVRKLDASLKTVPALSPQTLKATSTWADSPMPLPQRHRTPSA